MQRMHLGPTPGLSSTNMMEQLLQGVWTGSDRSSEIVTYLNTSHEMREHAHFPAGSLLFPMTLLKYHPKGKLRNCS